jgi:hypothetical protein
METAVWVLAALNLILLLWKGYFETYLKRKAENLATKEDVAKLTHLAEEVKASFTKRGIVFKAQFDFEFQSCLHLWKSACELRRAYERARAFKVNNQVTAETKAFADAELKYTSELNEALPFIDGCVGDKLRRLHETLALHRGGVDNDLPRINYAMEECKNAITARLHELSAATRI